MKIVCPNCATTYDVGPAAIGAAGRSVRCVRCRSVWFVEPGAAEPERELAAAAAPAMAADPPAPPPSAAPAAEGGLDDMAGWGLTDTAGSEPPAGDPADAPFSLDPALGDMQSLGDMQAAVPVTDGPPLVPVDGWQGATGDLAPAPEGESPGPSRRRPGALRGKATLRAPSMSTVILVLLAIITGILGWRADVVRVMPQTASLFAAIGLPVNLRGLAFEDVKATTDLQDGVPVLVLEGRIVNVSRLILEVPRIRFALRNAAGREVYNWTTLPTRPVLAPDAEQPFRTRLASPPAEGRKITVRFFTRRDAVGGFR